MASRPEVDSRLGWVARYPAALRDDYFGPDELRVEDLLAMAAQMAGSIQFRDAANRSMGTWDAFGRSDELFVISRLLAVNLARERDLFVQQLPILGAVGEGSAKWWGTIEILPSIRLARILDQVHRQLLALHSVAAMRARERIENVIEKSLAAEMQALKLWCQSIDPARASVIFQQFDGIWDATPGSVTRLTANEFLRDGFNAVLTAIQHLQGALRADFQHSLQRQDHGPAVGLLVAFLQLRQQVQQRLNRFSARHLDFYYDRVLRIASRPVVPDRTVLLLGVDAGGPEVLVPERTLFSGGVDAKQQERLYQSTSELRVTDASVVQLHSLWFERSAGVSPENVLRQRGSQNAGQTQFATSTRIRELPLGGEGPGNHARDSRPVHSLFGHREASRSANRGAYAKLGISIASRALAMQHGSRDIRITFEFGDRPDGENISDFVTRLAELLGTSKADAFFKTFRNAFQVSITEESGWYVFPEYLPSSPCVDPSARQGNSLAISLRLPPDAGAIVPFSSSVHGNGYSCDVPIVRFLLDEAYLFPYSLFAELTLLRVGIEVKVGGCREIVAHNQLGRLSTTSQFFPFGATPVIGDYLILGCEEAAAKNLTSLELDLTWAGLPGGPSGFAGHYRGYPAGYGNDSFKVRISALADRHWLPSNELERVESELFENRPNTASRVAGAVSRRRRIDLAHLCKILQPESGSESHPYGYDISTRSGFFRLTLSAPESGFGHREYPMALSAAVARSSKKSRLPLVGRFRKENAPEPLPAAPYTPVIDQLLVNYEARDEIDLRYGSGVERTQAERAFHIHPTGIEPLRSGRPGGVRMVPWYREDGHLLIGIRATALRGPLTLFFHLNDDCRPMREYRDPIFRWYYLAMDEWLQLAPDRILSDSTYGFLRSGIVALDVPANATAENRVCTSGLFWLRVSANWEDVANVCSLFAVHANAVEVQWQPDAGSAADQVEAGLPAGTICQSKANLVGISDIRQPVASWGGKQTESRDEKILRTSERLRHRHRAVTAGDYEKLVLLEFPDLFRVRCFPCCAGNPESPHASSPGDVFVVVLPHLAGDGKDGTGPMADAFQLKEIGRFISSLNSGIAHVRVSNPNYEQIQVRCKVRLRNGQNPGDGIAAINRQLGAFLSPWSRDTKITAFDWRVRCIDLQAHLQGLHAVTLATGVSLLRISTDEASLKHLTDTAREQRDDIRPLLPWSVAIPFRQHLIEVVDDSRPRQPSLAGFGNLAIGSTFIGTRNSDD